MEDVGSIFGSVNSSAGEPPPGHLSSPPTTGEAAPPGPAFEDMIAHGLGGDSAVPIDIEWHPFRGPECDSCITLGNITHSGERFITMFSLHGSAEILHHAILLLYEFTETLSEDRFITYLSLMDAESLGGFLENYRNCRVLDGYKILYDDCRPLYDVPFTKVDNSDGHTILEVRKLHSTPDITLVRQKSMDSFHVASIGPNDPDPNPTKDAESMDAESVGGFLTNYRNWHVLADYKIIYNDCQPLYDVPFTQADSSDGHTILEVGKFHTTSDIGLVGDKSMDVFHVANTGPNEPDPIPTKDVESMDAESVGGFLANYRHCYVLDGSKIQYDDCQPLSDVPFTQVDSSYVHTILEVGEFHSSPDIGLVGDKSMDVFHVANTGPKEPDPIPTKDVESMNAESVGGFHENYRNCHGLDGYKTEYDDYQPLYDVPFTQVDNSDGHTILEVRELNSTPDIALVGDKSKDVFHVANTGPNKPDPSPTKDAESMDAESVGGFLANYRNCHVLADYKIIYNDCQPLYDVPFTQADSSDGHTILEVRKFNSTPDIALVGEKSMDVFHVANTGPNEPNPIPTEDVESMDAESVGGFLANYRTCPVLDGYKILCDDSQQLYDLPFTQVDSSDAHTILEVRKFNSTPDIALVDDNSMDVFHVTYNGPNEPDPNPSEAPQLEIYPTEELKHPNEIHQLHGITSAEGPSEMGEDGGARIPTFGISQQRQRIMKMTFIDVSQYFNLPMHQAAQKLQICPSALKKVCRRFNINRWPYRKVASEKRWNVIFNINGDTPPDTVRDPSMETGL